MDVEFREYAARLRCENRLLAADDQQVEDADGRARNRNVYGAGDTEGQWSPQCPTLAGLSADEVEARIAG